MRLKIDGTIEESPVIKVIRFERVSGIVIGKGNACISVPMF